MIVRAFALLAGLTIAAAAHAQTLADVKMIAFGGATNLPVWYALEKGLFEKEGLRLTLDQTPGSKEQFADIMAGKYQFSSTAFDNIVAYTEGQGAVKYDGFDVVAVLGVHSGLNSVVARPEIKSWTDIKGKTLSVDALTSGYATVLYQILQTKGIAKDKDYKVISVGSSDARSKSLRDNTAQMAIIGSPQDLAMQKEGFNILADASAELGDYQGSVYAIRRGYGKSNERETLAFMRAIMAAHDAVFADRAGAIAVLGKRTRGFSPEDLNALYERMTGPGGLSKGAALNPKGVDMVLKLRSVYGAAQGPTPPASRYIDTSFAERAVKK
ncbi:ABC transporter substrate-binding protein [Roseiarcaceae bacterium H3SJ34-1]|uniref:ABC transporter substrate-binding protein n=1 Tax=Terripilifer ovatus TaxID=3032367 RepID=UPI003AB93CEF|nr:ABC transporter substrate-binding protein [Roseiarcaceae bacterium H3SJ34-1]